jgi:hypothetical protein
VWASGTRLPPYWTIAGNAGPYPAFFGS